jgi:hypothetical protein
VPRVNVEDSVHHDARFKLLGRLLGSDALAVGCMVLIWNHCTKAWQDPTRENPDVVSPKQLYGITGVEKMAEHLVACELGEEVDGGIRIRGAHERCQWMNAKQVAGRAGGKATASRGKGLANLKQNRAAHRSTNEADAEAPPNPLTLTPDPEEPTVLPTSSGWASEPGGEPEPEGGSGNGYHSGTAKPAESFTLAHSTPSPPGKVPRAPKPKAPFTLAEVLDALERSSGGRFDRGDLPVWPKGIAVGVNRQLAELARQGAKLGDLELLGEYVAAWSSEVQLGPSWLASSSFTAKLGEAKAWGRRGKPQLGRASPTARASSPPPDPRQITNLAAREAQLEAEGRPIPWANDPRRWAMTHDRSGKPLERLGPGGPT